MAITVDEIMSAELYSLRPSQPAARAIRELHALGLTMAPVLDRDRLVGVASLLDLVGAGEDDRVEDCMQQSPITVATSTPIATAARLMAEAAIHHLPVVDRGDRPIGLVSSLDLLRGVLGMPARHPTVFTRADPRTGMTWSDDADLEMLRVESAPERAGVLALVLGGADQRERVVWAEASPNLRNRLIELLTTADNGPDLRPWRAAGKLRFRTAIASARQAGAVVDALQRLAGYPRP